MRAEVLRPYGEGQIGLRAVVLCEALTVRQAPAASSGAVRTLSYGDFLIVSRQSEGWAECFLSDAVDASPAGWVNADYIAIDPAWYRTDGKTPVFAWSDTAAPKVALLDANTILPILKDEGEWLIVSLRGAIGWIHSQSDAGPVFFIDPAESTSGETGRRDGERFEDTIVVEGMEEAIRCEHIRNDAIGIEMDYDYERFERRGKPDREWFVSRYDDPGDPRNYLEVRYSAEDAEAVCASVSEDLSRDYELTRVTRPLKRAGSCVRIEASCLKGTDQMPDWLQAVYVIPAGNGCVVATACCDIEGAEGFGARISQILNNLAVIDSPAENTPLNPKQRF